MISLSKEDLASFKVWLNLDLDAITWQKKYLSHFDIFWDAFFSGANTLADVEKVYKWGNTTLQQGPLQNWLAWFYQRFICYLFLKKKISICELSSELDWEARKLSSVLRLFFRKEYPDYQLCFDECFHLLDFDSLKRNVTFDDMQKKYKLPDLPKLRNDDEVLAGLEITLYEDWHKYLKLLNEKRFSGIKREKSEGHYYTFFRFFKDASVFLGLALLGIVVLISFGKFYDQYLDQEIKLYVPDILSKSTEIFLKERSASVSKKNGPNLLLESDKNLSMGIVDEERFETESEVQLASLDETPQDLEATAFEKSDYEEELKAGYRDTKYGRVTVFRVVMTTYDVGQTVEKMNKLLKDFEVEQGDFVRPGIEVPGGRYYNLLVKRELLGNFLKSVKALGTGKVFETRTRKGNPPGQNKVFIWFKKV